MAPRAVLESSYSGLLSLPTELRCHIYDYVLSESRAVTISAAYATKLGSRVQRPPQQTNIAGLPHDLAPVAQPRYDASLLQVTKSPEISIDHGWPLYSGKKAGSIPMAAPDSLALTCRLIHDEMTDYKRGRAQLKMTRAKSSSLPAYQKYAQTNARSGTTGNVADKSDEEGLSLYVSYPYGILVLKNLCPHLLKQASRVYIAGHYSPIEDTPPSSPRSTGSFSSDGGDSPRLTPTNSFEAVPSFTRSLRRRSTRLFNRQNTTSHQSTQATPPTRPRLRLDIDRHQDATTTTSFTPFPSETTIIANTVLAQVIRTILPTTATPLAKMTANILYPGEHSYSTVWSDNNSPVIHVLRNMCGGKVAMRTVRGPSFTGLTMTAEPNPQARIVSTTWENWRASGADGGYVLRRDTTSRRSRAEQSLEGLDRFFEFH